MFHLIPTSTKVKMKRIKNLKRKPLSCITRMPNVKYFCSPIIVFSFSTSYCSPEEVGPQKGKKYLVFCHVLCSCSSCAPCASNQQQLRCQGWWELSSTSPKNATTAATLGFGVASLVSRRCLLEICCCLLSSSFLGPWFPKHWGFLKSWKWSALVVWHSTNTKEITLFLW